MIIGIYHLGFVINANIKEDYKMDFDELKDMIEDCIDRESRLSEWESIFIESIEEHLQTRKELSEKQEIILEKIWNKVTKKG